MLSEVKLIVQSDIDVFPQNGTFNSKFANRYLEGKKELFLSKNNEFMINSFRVNIDSDDINHTTYNNADGLQVDSGEGEIKYVLQNVENSRARLENEEKMLNKIEDFLDSKNYPSWKQTTTYLIIVHVNYKEDVSGVDEFEIATKHNLDLVQEDGSRLRHKDKTETQFSKYSKYSYLKHLKKSKTLHFYHCKVELKLVNNVTTSIGFFAFFEFYQIHKISYSLDGGRAFHAYLSQADTEIFTTFKKFTDLEGKYKGIFDHRVCFLVHEGGQVTTVKTENGLNMYIPKPFGEVLKKDNDEALFNILVKISHTYTREEIYEGAKGNVVRYGLKPFHTKYHCLDNEYSIFNTRSIQGTTEPLTRSLFRHNLIRDGVVQRQKDFSLSDMTGDRRLLKLLPEKSSDFYSLSNFYSEFTNFNFEKEDFFRFHGFKYESYRFSKREILDIFKIHIIHSNTSKTNYQFGYLPVFKFAKEKAVGQDFKDIFYDYLSENNTEVFTTEKKFGEDKNRNILCVINDKGQFRFLDQEIEDPGFYGIYQYISETFYSLLVNTNKRLKEIYSTWYLISQTHLLDGHQISNNVENIDQRVVRLLYCKSGLGLLDLEEIIAPIEEIYQKRK